MSKISTAISLLKKRPEEFMASLVKFFSPLLTDRYYLSRMYYYRMGKKINWNNPATYNEKLQWLKLYDRNPDYTSLVDKYEVKAHVIQLIGKEHVAETLGVWSSPDEIDFTTLPRQFVLKTTHGGGNCGVLICKDKTTWNLDEARKTLRHSLAQDLYRDSREWPYKNIQKRIIAEEYLEDFATGELRDYKFFCFYGIVKALFVATERQTREEPFFNFFDRDFKELEIKQGHPRSNKLFKRPAEFEDMIKMAESLSAGIPHVRIDLYVANGCIYFGEFTFYHFGGMVPFEPSSWDKTFGEWLKLPPTKNQYR